MTPFFSIVIPTYNRAQLVRESIDSALAQSFSDFEIVIVDDGSTDDTESIVRTISSNRILYYKKENGERGAARNFGIEKANGKYVVFMDSDDQMMINHLETLHEHLAQKEEDFIATKYAIFKDHIKKTPNEVKRLLTGYHNYKTFLIGNPLACCFTIRKANSNLIKFREELTYTIMEDWIFLMENLQSSKLYLIDKVTMGLRDHEMRSMRGSALIIVNARKNALGYLIESKKFSKNEQRILTGHSNYFCAVHSYLDGHTKDGFRYLMRSIIEIGFSINTTSMLLKLSLQNIWAREPEKRILVFTYWAFQDALIQTYTLPYLKIMADNQNLKIWLICLQSKNREISNTEFSSIQERLNAHRIQLILLKYRPVGVMGYINTGFVLIQLFYLTLTLRISIIHTWGTPAGALGYLIAKVLDRKLILDSYEPHAEATVENGDWKKNGLPFRFLFRMEKLQTHYAEKVIAVTDGMRNYAIEKYSKTFGSNFFVKPACVDFELFDYRKRNFELKESLGLKDKIVGLYAGKFGGIYLDIEFFHWVKVAEQYWGDKFRLLLLTTHSEKEIIKFCSEAGVSAQTIYQKFVPHHEVPMYMGLADFALSIVKPVPSKRYCSPIKDGEYWAMGLPVIITKGISDDSEIIQNERIGYVLESLNEKEYLNSVRAVEKCFSEPGIRDRIVRVAEKFRSFEIARDVYSHVYPE